jgi:hypothetical protein
VSVTWDDFLGPRHEDEIMAAHQGETHGVPMPEPDLGTDDNVKYGPGGGC